MLAASRTRAHSEPVIKGCDSTGSPGRFNLYCRNVLAARSLASAALCSRSKVLRKCGLTALTGLHLKTSSKLSHFSGSACNNEICLPSPLPDATKDGHQLAGPVTRRRCQGAYCDNRHLPFPQPPCRPRPKAYGPIVEPSFPAHHKQPAGHWHPTPWPAVNRSKSPLLSLDWLDVRLHLLAT